MIILHYPCELYLCQDTYFKERSIDEHRSDILSFNFMLAHNLDLAVCSEMVANTYIVPEKTYWKLLRYDVRILSGVYFGPDN